MDKMRLMVKHPKYIESAKTSKYNRMINDAIRAGYPILKGGK